MEIYVVICGEYEDAENCLVTTNLNEALDCISKLNILPIKYAIKIAITPFKISQINVSIAGFFPAVLSTFVLPAFPLPFCLTSKPAIFFVKIIEKLMLP